MRSRRVKSPVGEIPIEKVAWTGSFSAAGGTQNRYVKADIVYSATLKKFTSILLGLDTKQGEHSIDKLASRDVLCGVHCRILRDIEDFIIEAMLKTLQHRKRGRDGHCSIGKMLHAAFRA
jgi:hypothetical protein